MTFSTNQDKLLEQFNKLKGWEEKYRLILRLGKSLTAMDETLKVDNVLLNGCESNVWFYGEYINDRLHLSIYSDAKIIRGLISIISETFNGLNYEQTQSFDCLAFIENLGLLSHLSPSRGNGIRAIISAIQNLK